MEKKLVLSLSIYALGLLGCHFFSSSVAEAGRGFVAAGHGSYLSEVPQGRSGRVDLDDNPAVPQVASDVNLVPTTHKWWTPALWRAHPYSPKAGLMHAYPLSFESFDAALGMGYGSHGYVARYRENESDVRVEDFTYGYQEDLKIDVPGMVQAQPKVERYSDATVTLRWGDPHEFFRATLGQGVPFAYFTVKSAKVRISAPERTNIWYNQNGIIGLTVRDHHYAIFAPAGSQWEIAKEKVFVSRLSGKGYFSIALLPDHSEETLELFREAAYHFVVGTKIDWNYDEASSRVTTSFSFETQTMEGHDIFHEKLLVALFPHQWRHSDAPLTGHTYVSPRGLMRLSRGNAFTTDHPFNGVLPELPLVATDGADLFSKHTLQKYLSEATRMDYCKRWNISESSDFREFGYVLNKISRLVRIADQAQQYPARDLFLSELKQELKKVFEGRSGRLFYYDKVWKSLVGIPDSAVNENELNDHHINYGYIIQAAATIAQYDPHWSDQCEYGKMVNLLIKDVNNWDRNDEQFPFLRHFDAYSGHSWSNGASNFLNVNYQESSSESMNFATGLILWGSATHQKEIRDLGVYLYATEASAIEEYWFNVHKENFPHNFRKIAIGTIWFDGGSFSSKWKYSAEEIHGMNFLPITGGSLYLGHYPDYLRENQEFMTSDDSFQNKMFDIHTSVRAFYDPEGAVRAFKDNPDYIPNWGETKAHTYYWIHNLSAMGRVDTHVTANIPTYAVFEKGGDRCYVVYNPENHVREVAFSDGLRLNVRPHHLSSYNCVRKPRPCPPPTPSPVVTTSPMPSHSPHPTVTPTPKPSVTVKPTPSPTVSVTPTPVVTVSPTGHPTPVVTASPSPVATVSVLPTPVRSVTPSPTVTISPTVLPTPVVTASPSPVVTVSVLPTPVVSIAPTPTVTISPTVRPTPVVTVSPSPVVTVSVLPTPVRSVTPSPTVTISPTVRPTPVVTVSPSPVVTVSVLPTPVRSVTPSPTVTISPTALPTPAVTASPSPVVTVSVLPTPVVSIVPTPTVTISPTARPTPVVTASPSPVVTVSVLPTPVRSVTPSPTVTVSPTVLPTPMVTVSPSPVVTVSVQPTPVMSVSPTPSSHPVVIITAVPSHAPTIIPPLPPIPSPQPTPVITAVPTYQPVPSPSPTWSPIALPSPVVTLTPSPDHSPVPVMTMTPVPVISVSPSPSVSVSPSVEPTFLPTVLPTPYPSVSVTPSATPAPTSTAGAPSPGNPSDFSHRLELDYSGKIVIVLLPAAPSSFEVTHLRYRLDREPHHRSTKMKLDKHKHWRVVLTGLGPDGILDYSFSYRIGDRYFDSEWFQFSY